MVNRIQNAILAPFAGRNDPPQASNTDRLNQAWQETVGAGQAASSAHLEALRNSHMLQAGSDVLARDAQEFQAEQRVSQLEQDGIQLRSYLEHLGEELEKEKFQARAASAAHKLELDNHQTDIAQLQASVKQARDIIAERESKIQ